MTTGIYALYWEQPDLIYIGQSIDIEGRFIRHKQKLRFNKHSNYKVQETYNKYGLPKLHTLEVCNSIELNNIEVIWTREFNSIYTGLNIVEPGISGGSGYLHGSSKYSKLDILRVFRFLYLTDKSYKEISSILGVSPQLPYDIRAEKSHRWLQSEYPVQYHWMLQNTIHSDRKYVYTQGKEIVSPVTNIIHTVYNLHKFAIMHNLDSGALSKVLNGKRKSHKGWRLPTVNTS